MTKVKYHYIFGWEIYLDNESKFRDFINNHCISEDDFNIVRRGELPCLRIEYVNDRLSKIIQFDQDNLELFELSEESKRFKYFKTEMNEINYFVPTEKSGNSYLGSEKETPFTPPFFKQLNSPFQVIGKLSNKDKVFNWLPFNELYLTYPLFSGIHAFLFLDYTDPMNPIIINAETFKGDPYASFEKKPVHEFEKTCFTIKNLKDINIDLLDSEYWNYGVTGSPLWIQSPEIPRCPKSGNLMKFVCQLNGSSHHHTVKVKSSNLNFESEYLEKENKVLRFWGSGDLYVFMDPESKIVGMIIQDT